MAEPTSVETLMVAHMKSSSLPLIFLLIISAGTFACSTSSDGPSTAPLPSQSRDSLVLLDCSFETNGTPALDGWTVFDTSLVRFSSDVPPEAGVFSVMILGVRERIDWITWSIPATEGKNYLRLSWWAKRTGTAFPLVTLGVKQGPRVEVAHEFTMLSDTLWTSYSVLDSLTTEAGDSIWIKLNGGGGEIWEGAAYYDLVTLKRYYE